MIPPTHSLSLVKQAIQTLMLAVAFAGGITFAQSSTLGKARFHWEPVSHTEVAGYKVHWGTQNGVYTHTVDAGNTNEIIIQQFSEGAEYFSAVTAYSATGEESDYSDEISFVFDTSEQFISMEAEEGVLTAPMQVNQDGSNSWVAASPIDPGATVTMGFSVPYAANYYVWCRVLAPSAGIDAFDVSVDQGEEVAYYVYGEASPPSGVYQQGWMWSRIQVSPGDARAYALEAGSHTIRFRCRGGAWLDKVMVVSSPEYVPGDPAVAPAIVAQPQALDLVVGQAADFMVEAAGSGPLSYQWRKGGLAIEGATSASYRVESVVVSDAGHYSVVVTNAAGQATSDDAVLSVQPAASVILQSPVAATIGYGQSLADASLSGGTASVPGAFAFADPATVPSSGTSTHAMVFTPTDSVNYTTASLQVSVTVEPAPSVILQTPAAATIRYGQSLADASLSGGTASVPGTFSFAAPATVPTTGTGTHAVVFTPTDSVNYTTASGQASVTVEPAASVILQAPVAATIGYGQRLADAILTGGAASVLGTFAFADPALVPTSGTSAHTVVFTPIDSANYTTASGQVSVTVQPAASVILQAPVAATILYGQSLANATLSGGIASVPGIFAFANPALVPPAGSSTHTVIFTPTDSVNYTKSSVQVKVRVSRKLASSSSASLLITEDYPTWIGSFMLAEGQTGSSEDPDGDGIVNLVEYALADGMPDTADRGILPVVSIMTDGDHQYLGMTVQKNPLASGVGYLVEVSGDLQQWNGDETHTVIVSDTPETLVVRDKTPTSSSAQRFLRLKVTSMQP